MRDDRKRGKKDKKNTKQEKRKRGTKTRQETEEEGWEKMLGYERET